MKDARIFLGWLRGFVSYVIQVQFTAFVGFFWGMLQKVGNTFLGGQNPNL